MASATHQSNLWHFSHQTGVRIDKAHQQLLNAIQKARALEAKAKTTPTLEQD
jgi:hypothetical protein